MSELDLLFKQINKEYGGEVATLGVKRSEVKLISFSSPRLNYCLYGGIPRGRVIQFAGPFGSGKSTSALDLIANYQKQPDAKEVVYIDLEETFDDKWASQLGVDIDKIRMINPDGANDIQILQLTLDIIKTGEVGLVIIDSIATMVPEQIANENMDKLQRGGIAKSMTTFLNKVIPLLKKNECTLLLLNQVRDCMDNPYKMFTIPGGKALEHHSSVILIFQRGDFFDMNGKKVSGTNSSPYGHYVNASVYKTKICRPDRKLGFYTLIYTKGIDYINDTIDCGLETGLIRQRGAYFDIYDFETGEIKDIKLQGRNSLVSFYKENPEEYQKLYEKVMEKIQDDSN